MIDFIDFVSYIGLVAMLLRSAFEKENNAFDVEVLSVCWLMSLGLAKEIYDNDIIIVVFLL